MRCKRWAIPISFWSNCSLLIVQNTKQDTDCSRKEELGDWSNIPWEFEQLKHHQATLQPQVAALHLPASTLEQLFNQVLGMLTISKRDAVPCKNHNRNNPSSFSDRTKANKQHHTGVCVCYSASQVPQSLQQPPHCPLALKHLSSCHFLI